MPTYAQKNYYTLKNPHLSHTHVTHITSVCSSTACFLCKQGHIPWGFGSHIIVFTAAPALSFIKDSSFVLHVTINVPVQSAFPCNYIKLFLVPVVYEGVCNTWECVETFVCMLLSSMFLCCFSAFIEESTKATHMIDRSIVSECCSLCTETAPPNVPYNNNKKRLILDAQLRKPTLAVLQETFTSWMS